MHITVPHICYTIRVWSERTFGTREERGPIGPLKHLKKEADEAIADPTDIAEYADIFILLIDALWRAGYSWFDLLEAVGKKLAVIQTRSYPKPTGDDISEHDRTKD